jgi:hypothetical protein
VAGRTSDQRPHNPGRPRRGPHQPTQADLRGVIPVEYRRSGQLPSGRLFNQGVEPARPLVSWYAPFMRSARPRKVSAWLVTRQWIAAHPRSEVAAILSPRLGGVRVREFVELLHVTSSFTLSEQASMMWPRHGQTPYPAKFGQTEDGHRWEGEILCGNDPYLWARVVEDLTVEWEADGRETATWKERPRAGSDSTDAEQAIPE